MKVEDGLIQVEELIEVLKTFDPNAWIELKNIHKSHPHEDILEINEDKDNNIVTIYFE